MVATLATPLTAFPIGTDEVTLGGRVEMGTLALLRFTRLANLTGWPTISVPCGQDEKGLPVGLQVMGPAFTDPLILQVAHAYELARGPFGAPQVT